MTAIVILALIALFVGLRLYAVLGERSGHEQPILRPADKPVEAEARVDPLPVPAATVSTPGALDGPDMAYVPTAGPGVRALLALDPQFHVGQFLDGARAAYRLILTQYWQGDLGPVEGHVDGHVHDAFAAGIAQRAKDGLTLDNRLVVIDQAVIAECKVEHKIAEVVVRFEADIAAVTRNAAGEVVAGSLSDAIQTRDRWTFRRDVGSRDPNWLLVETDDEE